MKKAQIKLLEKAFQAEIDGLLPFQTKSREILALEEEGMVEPVERRIPGPGGVLRVSGWELTHRGRITYCEWAATQPCDEDI